MVGEDLILKSGGKQGTELVTPSGREGMMKRIPPDDLTGVEIGDEKKNQIANLLCDTCHATTPLSPLKIFRKGNIALQSTIKWIHWGKDNETWESPPYS